MLVLRVTYLTGRVYSAAFEDGDDKAVPEWPPHPSRLFSALVASWGDGGAEEDLIPALEWLEGLGAPTIYAGSCTRRKLVKTFVPVNDSALPPEIRSRKADVPLGDAVASRCLLCLECGGWRGGAVCA